MRVIILFFILSYLVLSFFLNSVVLHCDAYTVHSVNSITMDSPTFLVSVCDMAVKKFLIIVNSGVVVFTRNI